MNFQAFESRAHTNTRIHAHLIRGSSPISCVHTHIELQTCASVYNMSCTFIIITTTTAQRQKNVWKMLVVNIDRQVSIERERDNMRKKGDWKKQTWVPIHMESTLCVYVLIMWISATKSKPKMLPTFAVVCYFTYDMWPTAWLRLETKCNRDIPNAVFFFSFCSFFSFYSFFQCVWAFSVTLWIHCLLKHIPYMESCIVIHFFPICLDYFSRRMFAIHLRFKIE